MSEIPPARDGTLRLRIPDALRAEHEDIHARLARAVRVRGTVGRAAKALAAILHPHLVREEEYALPPLALLTRLSTGAVTPGMSEVLGMTERLRAALPQILAEHGAIVAAAEALADAARRARRSEYVHLAEMLLLHTQTEEEVLYPASLLIGEYLKWKLRP